MQALLSHPNSGQSFNLAYGTNGAVAAKRLLLHPGQHVVIKGLKCAKVHLPANLEALAHFVRSILKGHGMALNVDGKVVVFLEKQDEEGNDERIEVSTDFFEVGEPEVNDGDRQMGPELVYEVTAQLDEIGEVVWQVYEYPVGVINHVVSPDIDGQVVEEPRFSLEDDSDEELGQDH